jgi:hypothetical protein
MLKYAPIEKSGTLFVKPNWRYEALFNPGKYKLTGFTSIPKDNSGCLKRYLTLGLLHEINYKVPVEIQRYMTVLPKEQAEKLYCLWNRAFKRSKQRKLSIDTDADLLRKYPVWNAERIEKINDKFLKKAAYHFANFKMDKAIGYALELYSSKEHQEIFKFIGYCFYAKISDTDIAKRWHIPVSYISAIRQLFFDFSKFPEDRLASFTYLRQLVSNGSISELDFAFYKRVYELGELGLKAQTDFYNLAPEEKRKIEQYLGNSIIANTLNINFSLRTAKDAASYNNAVGSLANYYIKQAEMDYFQVKSKNIEVCTRRIEGSLIDTDIGATPLDNEMMALLREHSLVDDVFEYKTLDNLK